MAIQLPDVGTGVPADKTGDSPWLAMKKVRENFSDQNNAASRLVGEGTGNVMQVGAFGLGGNGFRIPSPTDTSRVEIGEGSPVFNYLGTGLTTSYLILGEVSASFPEEVKKVSGPGFSSLNFFNYRDFTASYSQGRIMFANGHLFTQQVNRDVSGNNKSATWGVVYSYYHTGNTTKDANGFLKAASPIVKVFSDKVELNGEAVDQDVTYKKNGIGDYTITTVSGLSTDGWYIELPKDMNGNPKVAVTLEETDGVISLKSYKRIFSMETFTFEPDLDNPLDIPDGRWIDLRLNEIPVEPSELETEV